MASQRMPARHPPGKAGQPRASLCPPGSSPLSITLHSPTGFPVGEEVFILTLAGLGGEAWPWQGGPPKGELTSWGTRPRT